MPSINDQFPSNYLKASDFDEDGEVVTIATVKQERMKTRDGKEETKPILFVDEHEKGLVLNKTNAKKITTLLKSDDIDDWRGMKIRLYATETEFGGDTVACIRVKQASLPTKKQDAARRSRPEDNPAPPQDDADIPF